MAKAAERDDIGLDFDYAVRFLDSLGAAAAKAKLVKLKRKKRHMKATVKWPADDDCLALYRGVATLKKMRAAAKDS